ncbi:KGK domain-containing protein [Thermoleptolyngbya sp.]|jgi:hypothetical protein
MNQNSKPVTLDSTSVVTLVDSKIPFIQSKTFRVDEALESMKRNVGKEVLEGIDCEALIPGNGWRKGKIKICFEFHPAEAEHTSLEDENRSHENPGNGIEQYPLDEVRQTI